MATPRGLRNCNPLNIRRVAGQHWQGEISSPRGATGVFRGATECGSGSTKGSESPFATEAGRGLSFCQFESLEYGLRAAFVLLRTYRDKHKAVCIEDIITRWAPSTENDTRKYISDLCKLTGFGGKERLTENEWPRLVQAMARIECGVTLSEDVILKGFRLYREMKK